jgi:flagellar motor switch protein FliG
MEAVGTEQLSLNDPSLRRGALLLSMIGEEQAVSLCRRLDPPTARRLIRVLSTLGSVDRQERCAVARSVIARARGEFPVAETLASVLNEKALGIRSGFGDWSKEEAESSLKHLTLLDEADVGPLWRTIRGEMPQAIAIIARHLSPATAARLLSAMPERTRIEVACRMASSRPATSGALRALSRVTDRLILAASRGADTAEGETQYLADVISQLPDSESRRIISAIHGRFREAAGEPSLDPDEVEHVG